MSSSRRSTRSGLDGSIDFPYIGRLTVAGVEPQDVAVLVKKGLVDAKILTDPQVLVNVTQYNSKHVSVIGQVTKPGSIEVLRRDEAPRRAQRVGLVHGDRRQQPRDR